MSIIPRRWVAPTLALMLSFAWQVRAAEPLAETITVTKTYNNAPFEYRSRLLSDRAQCRVYRLTYPSPVTTPLAQNNTVPADLYLPKQLQPGMKYPAVICLHILDGNEPLTEMVCSVLASRGIPAVSFKLPYYGSRGGPKGPEALAGDPKMFVGAIRQAGEDIRRTVDLLSSRPEVNPERIGITGISLGGIIAATAAGAEPRLHRAGLILAGGDVLAIIHHARETRDLSAMIRRLPPQQRAAIEAEIAAADPLRFAPALRERAREGRVLMLNAAEDEVVPRRCTEKLAEALGIADNVVWFPGVGHYTAMAELPKALRMTADFFAKDSPEGARAPDPLGTEVPSPRTSALQLLVGLVQQAVAILTAEPEQGRCQYVELEQSPARVRLFRGPHGKFSLNCQVPGVGQVALGQGRFPWVAAGGKTVLAGTKNPRENADPLRFVAPQHLMKVRVAAGAAGAFALAPEMLQQWIDVADCEAANGGNDHTAAGGRAIRITGKERARMPGEIRLNFREDGRTPESVLYGVAGVNGTVRILGWQLNTVGPDALFEPPAELPRQEVEQADLLHVFAAAVNFAMDRLEGGPPKVGVAVQLPPQQRGGPIAELAVVARDPAGHGLLCRSRGKTILMVSGTPAQMGAAQGTLLREPARKTTERVLYLVGGGDTVHSGQWFFDRMAEIQRRTTPHIPPRFLEECDTLGRAAGISQRDARLANLFPERFHCSGVALRGKATQGGRVLHARVLDYMRDIDLQQAAVVQVFMPEGRHNWISLGYAGFVGTVTAMNERGLAVGEMGGRGEGQWDGVPMSLLLRDVMERAGNVEEALAVLRAAPRTCQYYYVLSDRSGAIRALHCTPQQMTVLEPGQQHPQLPLVPEDTVLMSGDERAKLLSRRIVENYGRIDVPKLIEIIKRPVAMQSNLHDAVFAPETLEMWFADAGRYTPACDEPYAHVNLRELIEFYARQNAKPR